MSGREGRIRIAVAGAAGRMGRKVLEAALLEADLALVGALTLPEEDWVGRDLGTCLGQPPLGVMVSSDPDEAFGGAQVVIEFTSPHATVSFLPALARAGAALVSGTTGFQDEEQALLKAHARSQPVVWAPNMSMGANVLMKLVADVSRLLGPGYDLEILELHHRHKQDAPSGTALALAQAGLEPREAPEGPQAVVNLRARGNIGPRGGKEEVGVGVLRGGDAVGEHTAYFLGTGERMELAHRVTDRRAFAAGALRAARWVAGKSSGMYSMQDVLGLARDL